MEIVVGRWKAYALPGRLPHAGNLTEESPFAKTDTADAELAVNRPRPATHGAAGVSPRAELGLAGAFNNE